MLTRFTGRQVPILFHIHPVRSDIKVDPQGYAKRHSLLHFLPNESSCLLYFALRNLENKLVVDL